METTTCLKMALRNNDQVQVIAGREKGKTGKVLGLDFKTGRVTVEKVNMVKRHMKPTQKNPQGGVIEKESSLHYSNVQLMCPKCNRGVRFGIKRVEKKASGKAQKSAKDAEASAVKMMKVRACKRCGELLDQA
jgi:large subunit ribosomal protein L24